MPVAQLSTDELAAELLAPGDDARIERAGKDAAVKLPHGEVLGVGVATLRQLLDYRLAMVDDRVGWPNRVELHGERAGVLLVVVRPPGAGHPHGEPGDAAGALGLRLRLAERLVDWHAPCVLGRSETPAGSPSSALGDELGLRSLLQRRAARGNRPDRFRQPGAGLCGPFPGAAACWTSEDTAVVNKGATRSVLNSAGMIGAFMDFQNENRESNRQFQSEQIEVLKSKASADASRWEQEFAFKKKQEVINENRWKEEVLLRRE
ncbi:hypothetical protein PR002_g23027 [Phytophthora rubi]|uniref:Uncharacterized protein n=1 Tax=Phytophthora rubi TaxID=129364 RepID=A0A6A3IMM3_9STRA|nr:hypothetical protein PR002_g23027 [Phytophthora rubi]